MRDMRGGNSTIGAMAVSISEEGNPPESPPQRVRAPRPVAVERESQVRDAPQSAFRCWTAIRFRLRTAKRWAFFLDFDGTLVNLRRRPGDVRMTCEAKRVLRRLAGHAHVQVVIVSGRTLRSVRKLVALKGVRYFGVHGGERESKPVALSMESKLALEGAKRSARTRLDALRGIWIEDKGLSFAIHYRNADSQSARRAEEALGGLLHPWGDTLHVLNGSRVWEILPREIPGKFTAVADVLGGRGADTAVIYVGNDGTDEGAFGFLPDQITVRVGREPLTRARYFVRTPNEVLHLLARMEKELA